MILFGAGVIDAEKLGLTTPQSKYAFCKMSRKHKLGVANGWFILAVEQEITCDGDTPHRCANKLECISQDKVCNAQEDCSDLSDEKGCRKSL